MNKAIKIQINKMNEAIKIKLNKKLRGFKAGTVLVFGEKNRLLDSYWRARIKDSKIDKCLTILDKESVNQPDTNYSKKIKDRGRHGHKQS